MINKIFYPDDYFPSIMDIDYSKIYKKGIRGLIFDIDNTIVPYNTYEIPDSVLDLFKNLTREGFAVCFLSNNKKKRVSHFEQLFNIHAFHTALKPTPFGIWRVIKYLNLPRNKLAIIGDQIFTDIICGRTQKIYTILVAPLVERTDFINKFKRSLELNILNNKK